MTLGESFTPSRATAITTATRAGTYPAPTIKLSPPQGGEPERRRDERRMRRQAGATANPVPRGVLIRDRFGVGSRSSVTVPGHGVGHGPSRPGAPTHQRQVQRQASGPTEALPVLSNDVAAS